MSTLEKLYQKSHNIKKSKPKQLDDSPDDILTIICSVASVFNYKIGFFIFIIFILLNSTVFYFQVLNKISCNTYDQKGDKITEKGILIIGGLLVTSYLVLDALVRYDYL